MSNIIKLPSNSKVYIRIFAKINLEHRYMVTCYFLKNSFQVIKQKIEYNTKNKYISPVVFSKTIITRQDDALGFLIKNLNTGKEEKLFLPKEVKKSLPKAAKRKIVSTFYDEKTEPEVYVEASWWEGIDGNDRAQQAAIQDREYVYFAKEREEDEILAIEGVTGVDLEYNNAKQPVRSIIYVSKKKKIREKLPDYLAGLPVIVKKADFVLHAPSNKKIYPITDPNDSGIQGIGVKKRNQKYWLSACHVLMNDADISVSGPNYEMRSTIEFVDEPGSIRGNVYGYYGSYSKKRFLFWKTIYYVDCAIVEDENAELESMKIVREIGGLEALIGEKVMLSRFGNSIDGKIISERLSANVSAGIPTGIKNNKNNDKNNNMYVFKYQIAVKAQGSPFSKKGDSGSAVIYNGNKLVGMVISGPENSTDDGPSVVTPYKYIFEYLGLK